MPFPLADGTGSPALDEIVGGPAAALTAVALVVGPRARASGWAARAAVALATRWRGPRRVLLADLDLERPVLHVAAGVPNEEGVIDMVDYGVSLGRLIRPAGGGAFDLIPAGIFTPEPADILRHENWARVLVEVAARRGTLLAFVPSEAEGVEAVIERTGAVLVLAEDDEGRGVVERLPHPYAVLAILTPAPEAEAAAAEPQPPAREAAATAAGAAPAAGPPAVVATTPAPLRPASPTQADVPAEEPEEPAVEEATEAGVVAAGTAAGAAEGAAAAGAPAATAAAAAAGAGAAAAGATRPAGATAPAAVERPGPDAAGTAAREPGTAEVARPGGEPAREEAAARDDIGREVRERQRAARLAGAPAVPAERVAPAASTPAAETDEAVASEAAAGAPAA
ncbi:MAG TPA: hypothetical protein VFZ24_11825, partial [Longimicrobiales bacterium]